MKTGIVVAAALALLVLRAAPVRADGEVCSAADKQRAESAMRKIEQAEKAGRLKQAFDGATGIGSGAFCAAGGDGRRAEIIERTSKKLGAASEKAGRYREAFDYYTAPLERRLDYDVTDGDRALLKDVRARSGNYKAVSFAADWFKGRGNQAGLKAVRAAGMKSGKNTLAAEAKAFSAGRNTLPDLEQARSWFELAGEHKQVNARADQRGDQLLARGTFSAVERAFQYYEFSGNKQKLKAAAARSHKLGDEFAKQGQTKTAAKFYELAGDSAKAEALEKKREAQDEKAEAKRQGDFKKGQKSLEKELGF
jgi:hypothetical protein